MSTSKGTSLIDQNDLLKTKWGGNTLKYDINSAVNNFAKNLEEYNAANTLQQRKDELNALYGGNILNYKSGSDVYTDYKRDLDQINAVNSYASALREKQNAARQAESQKVQYADTRRQLMQKYLPETLMAQGVANTGYTADALLKAENNYNQYVLGAMNERANTEQSALKEYQDALSAYKMQLADAEYQDFLAKEEKAEAQAEAKEAEKATIMTTILGWMERGLSKDEVSAVKDYYLSSLNLSEEEINEINSKFNDFSEKYYANYKTPEQTAQEEIDKIAQTLNENYSYGRPSVGLENGWTSSFNGEEKDAFDVVVNGTKYTVKAGSPVSNSTEEGKKLYKAVKQADFKGGEVFAYNNNIYVVHKTQSGHIIIYNIVNRVGYQKTYAQLKRELGIA